MKQQGYGDDPLLCVVINGNRGTCRENPIAKEFTDLKLWYGRHPGKLDNHLLADAKIRNFNLEEILEVTPTTTPATTPPTTSATTPATTPTTKSTTSPVPSTTTPSTPSLTTTTLPPTTPEQTLDIKIWAGMVIYGIMVNGVRTGNNHGGGILDVPMQQGETVLALEYGVKRDQEGEPWANGICGLTIITDVKMHGPYGDIGPTYPCPAEYLLEIPYGMGLSEFLENEKLMDATGDWILGFNSQLPIM